MTSTKRLSPLAPHYQARRIRRPGARQLRRDGIASARSAGSERGTVEARGPVAKVVAVGPVAFHAYSEFAGGSLYTCWPSPAPTAIAKGRPPARRLCRRIASPRSRWATGRWPHGLKLRSERESDAETDRDE
jgi:hypothetical protein